MSDNVIRPAAWIVHARESLGEQPVDEPSDEHGLGPGDGGPHDPGMEARVAKLESSLQELRLSNARIEEALKGVATKADVAEVKGTVSAVDAKVMALDARIGRVETAVDRALQTALGKSIGPFQLPAIIVATAMILAGLAYAYQWLSGHPVLPR